MSVNKYEDFLESPLKLDERYPTIEEFLCSIPHFFLKKKNVSSEEYERISQNIKESQKGNRFFPKDECFKYLSFFFNTNNVSDIWKLFINRIFKPQTICTKKNFYLREILFPAFKSVWNLTEDYQCYWIDKQPNDVKPFTQLLKEEFEIKKEDKQYIENREQDNYRKWTNGATPQISTLNNFLEKTQCKKVPLVKEKFLSFWFWQKLNELYPFSNENEFTENNAKLEEKYAQKYDSLLTKIDFSEKIAGLDEELEQAKKAWPSVMYGNLLLLDFKFRLRKKDIDGALNLAQKMMPLYFYYGSYKSPLEKCPTEWYSLVLSFIAYEYSISKDKDKKKSLKSVFKKNYGIAEILGIERISLNDKSKEKIILEKFAEKFKQKFKSRFWTHQEENESIPKPNYKKANQYKITWGCAKNVPQLIFFTQLNEFHIVQKLLEQGASISASTLCNESALYWCLKHLAFNEHLSTGKMSLRPSERSSNEASKFFCQEKMKPFITFFENFNSNQSTAVEKSFTVFKEIFNKQLENAKNIFNALLPHYQSPKGNVPSAAFQNLTIKKENILNEAVCSLNLDIIKAVISLYEQYLGLEKKKEWMNRTAEFTPRTPIFWIVRLFEHKTNRKSNEVWLKNTPYESKFPSQPDFINLKAQSMLFDNPYELNNFHECQTDVEGNMINPVFNFYQNLLDVWESAYLDESVSEDNFLSILEFLLKNEASPIETCDCSKINRPKNYNALKLATEIGWQNGVSIMTEWLLEHKKIQAKEIEELRQLAIAYEKCWDRGGGAIFFDHEERAQKCHILNQYFQNLISNSF